jgi:hypothetical protein
MLTAAMMQLRRDFAARIAHGDYHYDPERGLHMPGFATGQMVGVVDTAIRRGGELIDRQVDFNLLPEQGLNHLLDVGAGAGTQLTAFYIALFSGNYTPAADDTAANWVGRATEFTSYDEATREVWTSASASGGSKSNSASKAEFTMATGVTAQNLYGAALCSASAKSATTGKLLAIARFGSTRVVNEDDVLVVGYTLTLTS